MMKKLMILLMIGMFMFSFVSATQESLGEFKQDECIDLIISCSTCSYVNFDMVMFPDGYRENLGNATKEGSIFNHTFCNTTQLGEYKVYGHGDLDGTDTDFAYNLFVIDDKPSVFIIIISYLLAIFLVILSFNVEYGDALKYFASLIFLIMGLVFLLYDFGIKSQAVLWSIILANWGLSFLIIFKNIEYWIGGLE